MIFVNRPETPVSHGGAVSINIKNKLNINPSGYIENNLYKTVTPGGLRMQARSTKATSCFSKSYAKSDIFTASFN